MRPYGIPRNDDVQNPDCGDIYMYGFKSCVGNIRRKNGKFRSSFRSSIQKRKIRRIWKRKARIRAKEHIYKELIEYKNEVNKFKERSDTCPPQKYTLTQLLSETFMESGIS